MGTLSNIGKSIKNFFGMRQKAAFLTRSDFGLADRMFGPEWSNYTFLETYGKSLYVYACVSKIAEKVGSIDFRLNRITNSKGDIEEIQSHEILDLLYRMNPFYTKAEFIETDVINRKLTGDSFILKLRNNQGRVVELWNIRPDLVTIIGDPKNFIGHYELVGATGTKNSIQPTDMIHIKYPSPLNTFLGMSPLSSAKQRVDTEEYATRYQKDFFLNNARPDGIIEMEGFPTDDQKGQLRAFWKKQHQGVGKNSKTGFLWGNAKYHQVSLSQREMDYIESLKFTRDDILVAFKVPKPIVAVTDDVNRANAETAQEIFLNETVIPEMKRFCDKINEELIAPEWGEEYFITFDDPVPVSREMILKEFEVGIDKWLTINEVRRALNKEPMKGGDVLFRPLMDQPVGQQPQAVPEQQAFRNLHGKRILKYKLQLKDELEKEIERIKEKVKKEVKGKIKKRLAIKGIQDISLFSDKDKRKQYWEYRTNDIGKKSQRMRSLVITLKNQQKDRFISNFKKEKPKDKAEIRKLFNKKEENQEFKKAILPLMFSMFKEAGEDAIGLLRGDKPFNVEKASPGKTILQLLEKRASFFASTVNQTTLEALVETLAEGIGAGEGIPKLENRIILEYDDFQKYRAERIARTETTAVVNEAHLEAYDQSEVVEGKEWVATLDDRVRDEHLALDGEIVALDENFSNGLDYPQEPNCRCTIAPVVRMK
jgi:HK97 family phage portal protein